MPIHLRLGAEDLLRCRFAVSPLLETHEAIRALRRTDRHGYHQPWLRRMRAAARGLDLAPLWLFMPRRSPAYTPDFLGGPPETAYVSVEEGLARLRGTDPSLAHAEMTRSLATIPGAADSALGRELLADPAAAVGRLADLTERAWHALVEPYWPRLRDLLEAEIAFRARQLATGGLQRLFDDLHPGVTYASGLLSVRTRTDHCAERRLGGDGLLLMPSVFVWPDVVSGFRPPWQPTVIYPARGIGGLWSETGPRASEALTRLLGRGRAAVLAALDEPDTTSSLARRLGLAPSSVSTHLTTLRAAGLLTARRERHRVLYERTPLGIAVLGAADRPPGATGSPTRTRTPRR
jgi:DNA-binding transcriptional ArsR family regulator